MGILKKALDADNARSKRLLGITKKCPDCREDVPGRAKVCRVCGYRFSE